MPRELRDILSKKSYKKKVITDIGVTLGNKPTREDIELAIKISGTLPTDNLEFELNDKKGNVFLISYDKTEDAYYYVLKTLVASKAKVKAK